MSINCKKCGSDAVCKNGIVVGKQRYLCKVCGMNFTEGDSREKHSYRIIRAAIELYLEGNGFRRISRLLKKIFNIDVCYQLVIHWIKSAAQKIDLIKQNVSNQRSKVPLLEMDELYTYIKKNRIKSEYGLLLIETGCVLLDLKPVMRAQKHSENSGIE
jgi:transposase-like protein